MLCKYAIAIFMFCLGAFFIFAQDFDESLEFVESYSANYFEELDSDARFNLQIRLRDPVDFKGNCNIRRGPFSFYLRSSTEKKEAKTTAGFSYTSSYLHAGIGRGRPHIARGMILGNTMMGFTADPRNNYRMSRSPIQIRNFDYYPSLMYLGGSWNQSSLTLMYLDRTVILVNKLELKNISTNIAVYFSDKGILESWTEYRSESWRGSLDFSLSPQGWNHICADLLFRCGDLQVHSGSLFTSPSYSAFKADADWGTSLQANSRALCAGINFSLGNWKIMGAAYHIQQSPNLRQRLYLDLQYRRKAFQAGLGLQVTESRVLGKSSVFPFPKTLLGTRDILWKTGIKFSFSKTLQLDVQILADLAYGHASAALLRLSYRKNQDVLRLQITRGCSAESILYLLRPLDASSYSIQRMPVPETLYVDLVYAPNIAPFQYSILVNASGLMFKMSLKT